MEHYLDPKIVQQDMTLSAECLGLMLLIDGKNLNKKLIEDLKAELEGLRQQIELSHSYQRLEFKWPFFQTGISHISSFLLIASEDKDSFDAGSRKILETLREKMKVKLGPMYERIGSFE